MKSEVLNKPIAKNIREYIEQGDKSKYRPLLYCTFDKMSLIKEIIYCEDAKDSNDGITIMKEYNILSDWEKFDVSKFEPYSLSNSIIKNDSNLYININSGMIYQILCGNLCDCNNNSIPGAFTIRNIGYIKGGKLKCVLNN